MTAVLSRGPWKIIVSDDKSAASYPIGEWLEYSELAPDSSFPLERSRAVVEVRRRAGGISPRALVGGQLSQTGENLRVIRVGQSGKLTLGELGTCSSGFENATSLVPGMPPEFAQPVLDGLVENPSGLPVGGTLLVVDRSSYDEINSSAYAFRFASSVLLITLIMRMQGKDLCVSAMDLIPSG